MLNLNASVFGINFIPRDTKLAVAKFGRIYAIGDPDMKASFVVVAIAVILCLVDDVV